MTTEGIYKKPLNSILYYLQMRYLQN